METSIDTSMDRLALNSYRQKVAPSRPALCCIYPYSVDRLRLINVPRNLMPAFRIVIQIAWSKGIQSEGTNDTKTFYEVKLRGYPWAKGSNKSAVAVERSRLTTSIMRFMLTHGWALQLSTQLQVKSRQDSWFFRKKTVDANGSLMCAVSLSSPDKIRVVDGAPEVVEAVRSTLESHCSQGLERHRIHCGADEFKLKHRAWSSHQDEAQTSELIMHLNDALESAGWTLYASVGTAPEGGAEMILKKSNQ